MKLKTLKEIVKNIEVDEDNMWNGGIDVLQECSKQEAIKHIKAHKKCIKELTKLKDKIKGTELAKTMPPIKESEALAINEWIKHFFNITDEDLK